MCVSQQIVHMPVKHISIRITGKVQGVFFRAAAKEQAEGLNITGFVRNEPDGSVYLEAEGEEIMLEQLTEWCAQGPPRARVDRIDVNGGIVVGFHVFELRR